MAINLKPCPWCGEPPTYYETTICANYDNKGNSYKTLRRLPHYSIECSNVQCHVRPCIRKINDNSVRELWNKQGGTP